MLKSISTWCSFHDNDLRRNITQMRVLKTYIANIYCSNMNAGRGFPTKHLSEDTQDISQSITKTYIYLTTLNPNPLLYSKTGVTGVNIIFLISAQKQKIVDTR